MSNLWRLMLGAVAFGLTGCASIQGRTDQLCSEIVAFANATPTGETKEVALTTVWGPTPDAPDSMFNKHCEHREYGPGEQLCQYLMTNTSTEFANINYQRAYACLDARRVESSSSISIEKMDALVWALDVPHVNPGIEVGLGFKFGVDRSPVLTIMARKLQP